MLDVSLSSNNLRAVPKQLFERLRQMESLNISNNTVAFMPDIDGTIRLNRLDVGNNRGFQLVCECWSSLSTMCLCSLHCDLFFGTRMTHTPIRCFGPTRRPILPPLRRRAWPSC